MCPSPPGAIIVGSPSGTTVLGSPSENTITRLLSETTLAELPSPPPLALPSASAGLPPSSTASHVMQQLAARESMSEESEFALSVPTPSVSDRAVSIGILPSIKTDEHTAHARPSNESDEEISHDSPQPDRSEAAPPQATKPLIQANNLVQGLHLLANLDTFLRDAMAAQSSNQHNYQPSSSNSAPDTTHATTPEQVTEQVTELVTRLDTVLRAIEHGVSVLQVATQSFQQLHSHMEAARDELEVLGLRKREARIGRRVDGWRRQFHAGEGRRLRQAGYSEEYVKNRENVFVRERLERRTQHGSGS